MFSKKHLPQEKNPSQDLSDVRLPPFLKFFPAIGGLALLVGCGNLSEKTPIQVDPKSPVQKALKTVHTIDILNLKKSGEETILEKNIRIENPIGNRNFGAQGPSVTTVARNYFHYTFDIPRASRQFAITQGTEVISAVKIQAQGFYSLHEIKFGSKNIKSVSLHFLRTDEDIPVKNASSNQPGTIYVKYDPVKLKYMVVEPYNPSSN